MSNPNRRFLIIGIVLISLLIISVSIVLWINTVAAQTSNPPYGMMNWWQGCPMHYGLYQPRGYSQNTQERLSIYDVREKLEAYISRWRGLSIIEIMEFSNNFYAIAAEDETGWGAFELIIDPYTGVISPEPGPNMMWNLKYGMHNRMQGMMGQWTFAYPYEMPVSSEEAVKIAYKYLSQVFPGREIDVEKPTIFYGYYTLDYKLDGVVHGMLSVNGFSGDVWYHSWHGDFIQEIELMED